MTAEILEVARDLLARCYGVEGDVTPLGGENVNLLVELPSDQRYVLKIQSPERDTLSRLEMAAAGHVGPRLPDLGFPRAIPSRDGELIVRAETTAGAVSARLLEYIDGVPWYEGGAALQPTLRDLGRTLARLDGALASFDHPAAHRTHDWDLTVAGQHRASISAIDSAEKRARAERLFQQWAALAQPRLAGLPHSVIHGDANDENILLDGDAVIGVIDFGDALVNPTICELAIALAYAMLDAPEPLDAAAEIVAGYAAVRPLADAERDVLFPLICGRLGTTVAVAAKRRKAERTKSRSATPRPESRTEEASLPSRLSGSEGEIRSATLPMVARSDPGRHRAGIETRATRSQLDSCSRSLRIPLWRV
jgi:Ser/Thr protein kinase RdoA (MazF antagonist)